MNQPLLKQYNEKEIIELLKNNVHLVYVDTGSEEVVARYEDLPDIIVDINDKLGYVVDLKVYDYQNPSSNPILTTFGPFLNKCEPKVREDIIDRLVKLQHEEESVKDYKVIDEDMLDDVRNSLDKEMER